MELRPGWKTSEFWLILATILVVAFSVKLGLTSEHLYIIGGLAGVYTGGRSFTKAQASKGAP